MREEIVRDELQKIQDEEGKLTAKGVVDVAREESHPLHSEFEWDDSKAGERYRMQQARALIRSVTIVVRTDNRVLESPHYVRDPRKLFNEQGYVAVPQVKDDELAARLILRDELKRVIAAVRRLEDVADVLGVQPDLAELRIRLEVLQSRAA